MGSLTFLGWYLTATTSCRYFVKNTIIVPLAHHIAYEFCIETEWEPCWLFHYEPLKTASIEKSLITNRSNFQRMFATVSFLRLDFWSKRNFHCRQSRTLGGRGFRSKLLNWGHRYNTEEKFALLTQLAWVWIMAQPRSSVKPEGSKA